MSGGLRAITRHVPFRAAATIFTTACSVAGLDRRPPTWRVSDGPGGLPAMELNTSSPFQRRMYYFPRAYWERLMGLPFGRYMDATLKEGQVFLDIGANIGFYTLFAAKRVGRTGRVVCFEPDPMTFESLSRSVRQNGFDWVRCMNMGLSDRDGVLPFHTVSDGSAHSLVPEIARRAGRYSGHVDVKVTSLDALVGAGTLELPRVDLVKLDVEGEEPRTVAGMLGTLAKVGHPRVWAEVRGPRGSTRAPNTYPAVARALERLGYRPLQWKSGGALRPVKDSDIRGREDVLFVHD